MDTVIPLHQNDAQFAALPLSARVYVQVRTDLMNGGFSPFTRLGEEKLASRYSVSRTPVREALRQLLADGLVIKRDGGLYPHVPSFTELTGLYELRVTLEQQGIVRAIQDPTIKHDSQRLDLELSRWHDIKDSGRVPDASFVVEDELFHRTLLDAAGNSTITQALDQVSARIRSVRMYDYLTEDRLDATISEHIELLELVLQFKLPQALDFLRDHIGTSREVVTERATRALALAQLNSSPEDFS